MTTENDRIHLKIDIRSGTLELDAPTADFDQAIQKTKELAATLELGKGLSNVPEPAVSPALPAAAPGAQAVPPGGKKEKVRATNGRSVSTARPGRVGSFEPIRDLLSEKQHQELHSYAQSKAPVDQEDQILVVVHKGEELLSRQGFSYNEIYALCGGQVSIRYRRRSTLSFRGSFRIRRWTKTKRASS